MTGNVGQRDKLNIVEMDVESPRGEKRLAAVGLDGNIPIVTPIDVQYRQRRKDGSHVTFVNSPAIKGARPDV